MDRAAWAFITSEAEAQGLGRGELARLADIPYQTVRGWYDAPNGPALSLADVGRLVSALGVSFGDAYEAIERLAVSMEESAE